MIHKPIRSAAADLAPRCAAGSKLGDRSGALDLRVRDRCDCENEHVARTGGRDPGCWGLAGRAAVSRWPAMRSKEGQPARQLSAHQAMILYYHDEGPWRDLMSFVWPGRRKRAISQRQIAGGAQ